MTLNISVADSELQSPARITVVGVGGAGGNAVNNMIKSNLGGVSFIVANTDSQALEQSSCEARIQLGVNITQGLGAGSRPDIGRAAAEEMMDEVLEHLAGSNMVFITGGMGGGTGTGAAPVIARIAREQGILTVGVVTKPFLFEGSQRMHSAEQGIQELQQFVDTLIVIPNQNLFRIANEHTTFADAFKLADDVLYSGVRGVTDLMVNPGLVNLDFSDIRTVMSEMGKAMMGTGDAEGDKRAVEAAEAAISNPLLDEISMRGAKAVLINITGGMDITLYEVDEAANRIREEVDSDANIIWGSAIDTQLDGRLRVSVVATGIEGVAEAGNPKDVPTRVGGKAAQALGVGGKPFSINRPVAPAASVEAKEQDRSAQTPSQLAAALTGKRAPEPAGEPNRAERAASRMTPQAPAYPAGRTTESADPAGRATEPAVVRQALHDMPRGTDLPRQQAGAPTMREERPPSLFERVTGGTRTRREEPQPARPQPRQRTAAQQQQRLGGLDTTHRSPTGEDDDMLDIPTFLRRQAN